MNVSQNPAQQARAKSGDRAASLRERLKEFWQRVTEGLELEQLWQQFRAEARESYGLYSREVDWKAIEQEKKWKWFLYGARDLFMSMLMKLSPSRRVLLLLALALEIIQPSFRAGGREVDIQFGGLGFALVFLLLALELADRVTMKRDLEIAREIQHWLMPESPPQVAGLDIAFATRPANTVAGDYYDAFLRPAVSGEPKMLFAVADVAGKSVPAALLMATFQASLQSLATIPGSLLDLVDALDRYVSQHSLGGRRFTTGFLAEFEPVTKQLTYVNAGHNAPILRRNSGETLRLEAGGLPLGLRGIGPAAGRYESGSIMLAQGDVLLVFTDGLIEAVNPQGEEFSEGRLLDVFHPSPAETAKDTLARVMAQVEGFVASARQHDDITCLVLRATS